MISFYLWIYIIFWGLVLVLSDDEYPCDDNGGVFPHPGECQLYYDCRFVHTRIPPLFEQHLFECPYPFLFSEENNRCEWFEFVDCGKRHEPISGCDYRSNNHPTRRPCILDFPHCSGQPDGPNIIESKLFTSSYAVCYKGRFLYEGQCPRDSTGYLKMFDPNTLKCVSLPW